MKQNTFRIAAISKQPNSFGAHGHILVAKDGEAWEVGRHIGSWLTPWNIGTEVIIGYEQSDNGERLYNWPSVNCEIPRKLSPAPKIVIEEIYAK